MEAPENIYFTQTENGTHYYTEGIPFERNYIEYIRKDAFIEKAALWIMENASDYCILHNSYDTKELVKDFVDAMKRD